MSGLTFVVGHEDTPEAYWRVLRPARALDARVTHVDSPRLEEMTRDADIVWLYQPTSFRAAELAEEFTDRGRRVIVDFSEDPWSRYELETLPYQQARLDAAARSLTAAYLIVTATLELAEKFGDEYPRVRTVKTVAPVWETRTPEAGLMAWWSDGRQRTGWEQVSGAVSERLANGDSLRSVQYAHHQAIRLPSGTDEEKRTWVRGRLAVWLEGEGSADYNVGVLRDATAPAWVHLEAYPFGEYRRTVSELPLLRAAALGIPTITTRTRAHYPGSLGAKPDDWPAAIQTLASPGIRSTLANEGLEWARSRSSFEEYQRTIEEV